MPGIGSGARGDDLSDGTEVKSCNKVDQVDKCRDCGGHVLRFQDQCPNCRSTRIERKDDSKWLFSPRSVEELNQYLNLDRLLLILMDYPNFAENDFSSIRLSSFEIYPKEPRMSVFGDLITNYFHNIYLPKHNDNNGKTNPMNLHPYSFQFYKCNPIKTFECVIYDIDGANPSPQINFYIDPNLERGDSLESLDMPSSLLFSGARNDEWGALIRSCDFESEILPRLTTPMDEATFRNMTAAGQMNEMPFLDEYMKAKISLRPINALRQRAVYTR